MIIALVILFIALAVIYFLLQAKNIKVTLLSMLTIVLLGSITLCFTKPILHKQFSINIIDYIIKFNTDGSMTTTKQTTITTIKEGKE